MKLAEFWSLSVLLACLATANAGVTFRSWPEIADSTTVEPAEECIVSDFTSFTIRGCSPRREPNGFIFRFERCYADYDCNMRVGGENGMYFYPTLEACKQACERSQ